MSTQCDTGILVSRGRPGAGTSRPDAHRAVLHHVGPGDARPLPLQRIPEGSCKSSWVDLPSDDSTAAPLPELA